MKKIFYCWQSDLKRQKEVLEESLNRVITKLNEEINSDFTLDQDTKNTITSDNVTRTVLQKIKESSLFIADISIVHSWFKKAYVNQNVMFELGFALKKLGTEKIILLFNKKSGNHRKLPFDIMMMKHLEFSTKAIEPFENDLYNILKEKYEKCNFREIYDDWDQHDITCINRILQDIPPKFDERLDILLLNQRRYRRNELDDIHDIPDKITDDSNHLINLELRYLVKKMGQAFSSLGYTIASKFAPDRANTQLQVLDSPADNDLSYQKTYYDYLNRELPEAINNAAKAYADLSHRCTELFGSWKTV